MYQVHTGLCRFMSVPYYSMVHTGSYSVHTGTSMNSVHTTGHDSSLYQFPDVIKSLNLAGLLEYFGGYILDIPITAHHHRRNLNPKSFKRPFATRNSNALLARAAAGEQAMIII